MKLKTLVDLNGKEISKFWIIEEGGDPIARSLAADETAFLSSEHCGDHQENWVVVMKGEKETSRHNASYVESIEWKAD